MARIVRDIREDDGLVDLSLDWMPVELIDTPQSSRESWRDLAACRDHPHPEWWFPERNSPRWQEYAAKGVCARCPVKDECGAEAPEEFKGRYGGIWGGLTGAERANRKRRRSLRLGRILSCVVCGEEFPDNCKGPVNKYCSKTCDNKARYRRKRGLPIGDVA